MKIERYMRALSMLISTIAAFVLCGQVQASADTVVMTVERSSIGGDLIMEPREVSFTPGETYADLVQRALDGLKAEGRITGYSYNTGTHGFYLQGIDGVDCGIGNMPSCVRQIFEDRNAALTGNPHPGGLYEFSYAGGAGWMYYVNNEYMNGMSLEYPRDGDVVRLMFTTFTGADLTGSMRDPNTGGLQKVYYTPGDKTGLIRLLCEADRERDRWSRVDGYGAALSGARAVLMQMDATAADVAGAEGRLRDIRAKAAPTSLAFTTPGPVVVKLTGAPISLAGSLQMQPAYDGGNLRWDSSDIWVARTDQDGNVTPIAAGTCTITAQTYNGLSASCTVTVTAEQVPVRGVSLSRTDMKLLLGGAPSLLTYTLDPVNADVTGHSWSSADPQVAAVDADGRVTAVSKGETDVTLTVQGPDGRSASAVCRVTVGGAAQSLQMDQEALALRLDETPQPLTYTYIPADSADPVRWESSDPRIAEVDSEGRLTLKGVGEARISVISTYDQDVRAVCRLTVLPSRKDAFRSGKPAVQKPQAGSDGVHVTWEPYEGADSYRVLRRGERELFALLGDVPAGKACTYTDTEAEPGRGYYYTVQAVSDTLGCWSSYDTDPFIRIPEASTPEPGTPTPGPGTETPVGETSIQGVARAAYNKLRVTWTKAAGATGYRIYRSTSAKGAYKKIKDITGQGTLSYTDTGLATGTTYYYKVRPLRKDGQKVTEGPLTAARSGKPTLGQAAAKVSAGRKKARISWSKVDGATGYVLYRATSPKGAYKAVKTVKKASGGSHTDKKLKKGKTYYYKVRAYRNVGGKRAYGPYSAVKRARVR